MRKHYFASKAGMVLPLLVLCVCAFGFVFAPNDPELVDLTKKFLAPCPEFPLGADNLGRCVLSRLLYGGRTTLGIVLVGSVMRALSTMKTGRLSPAWRRAGSFPMTELL